MVQLNKVANQAIDLAVVTSQNEHGSRPTHAAGAEGRM